MTASDVLVESLTDCGVDTILGLPGDGINGFVAALRKAHDRIRYVHVRPRGKGEQRDPELEHPRK